jgi:hypothetical protein
VGGKKDGRAPKKLDAAGGALIGENLRIGETAGIVDGDMDELPTGSANRVSAVAGVAVTDPTDASELLDIEVDELSGPILLVSSRGFLRVQILQTRKTGSAQQTSHRRWAKTQSLGDLGSRHPFTPQRDDPSNDGVPGTVGTSSRPGASIQKRSISLSISPDIPVTTLSAHACHRRSLRHGYAFDHDSLG